MGKNEAKILTETYKGAFWSDIITNFSHYHETSHTVFYHNQSYIVRCDRFNKCKEFIILDEFR